MPRIVATCCLAIFAALMVVGVVSHGILRHVVQTAPLWPAVVLGLRRDWLAKFCALPCFVIWLFLMVNIWLYLLGYPHILSGTFTQTEVAMTLVVGAAAVAGIVEALRVRTSAKASAAAAALTVMTAVQLVALRISFLPGVAHD
ncbi:MAG TPA: hypothetical protein VGH20_10055 [Myxococcales bacterium]